MFRGEELRRTATTRKGLAGRHRDGTPPALRVYVKKRISGKGPSGDDDE